MAAPVAHRVRWFAIVGAGDRLPRNSLMADSAFGWDVACSCGWETRTGGGIAARIRENVEDHKAGLDNCAGGWFPRGRA